MSEKKKPAPMTEMPQQAVTMGIRLQPSTASYETCMRQTAVALGYPGDKPLRSSPNMYVLSLTGLGSLPAAIGPGLR